MMQQNDRIKAVSMMRVLAMTMIVAFHSFYFYTGLWWIHGGIKVPIWAKCARFLDSLDLSMFVFISGFLFGYLYLYKQKYRDWKAFICGKLLRLIVPYLFWGVFMLIAQPSLHSWNQMLTGISHLWFLLMLFWVFCISSIIIRFRKKNTNNYNIFLYLLLLYSIWYIIKTFSDHHSFLCIETSLSYLMPFYIGFICSEKQLWHSSLRLAALWGGITLALLFYYVFFMPLFEPDYNDLLIRILSYSSIPCLFILLSNISVSTKLWNVIVKVDKLSLGVYIFNPIVINAILLNSITKEWLITNCYVGPFIIFVVSLVIPLCLSWLFNKTAYLSWTIGT